MNWELDGNATIVERPDPVEGDTLIVSQPASPDPTVLMPAIHTVFINVVFAHASDAT